MLSHYYKAKFLLSKGWKTDGLLYWLGRKYLTDDIDEAFSYEMNREEKEV